LVLLVTVFPVCTGSVGWAQTIARMNVGIVGGGTPAAGGGASYGEGNLLSERWGAQGTWAESGDTTYTITYNDTTNTGTGFDGSQLKITVGTDSMAYVTKDLGGAQSAVYFRFYYLVGAEGYADGNGETIFVLAGNGENMGDQTYLQIFIQQVATNQLQLRCAIASGTGITTGTDVYNISTGTIYKIEGKVVDDGANGSMEWKVNGSSIGSRAGLAAFGTVAIQDVHVGVSWGGGTLTHYFDTLDISSTGYLTDTP